MSIYKELSYDQEIDVVRGIQFSVLGPDEIKKRSVVEVTKSDTYNNNEPVVAGLFDPRMGVLEHGKPCATCEQKNTFCPGHFGHIDLARPVYHPLFFDTVRKLLGCVCYRCSRLMVSPKDCSESHKDDLAKAMSIRSLQKRWEAMQKICGSAVTKGKTCGFDGGNGCDAVQPTRYIKEGAMKIVAEWKDIGANKETKRRELMAEDVHRIFSRITDEDCEALGLDPRWNRPEYMISTVVPVPPPAVRPSIIEENGQRREDDLTHKLADIVKTNNQLKARIEKGGDELKKEEHIKLITLALQYHIATFIDNQIPGLPPAQQRNGRKTKGIADRLKKKEGRIRGNLNGKRVDQSARSVITPDPYIGVDEVGVPVRVAMNTTFPEAVNRYNIEEMRRLVRNGPDTWPGAKYVRSLETGVTKTLKNPNRDKLADELREGDIVDRHVRDGDYILFNRQPSLHKMSMMGHRVRVMPYQTFRLSPLACAPYNADFDGDEMNSFLTQSIQSMSELMDLAAVPFMTLAPRDGKPILEVIQDTMVGAFRMTKNFFPIADKTMANLQMVNGYFKGTLPAPKDAEGHTYTGHQLYSELFPPAFFLDTPKFKVENSQIVKGVLDKKVYHSISDGIIPVLFHDYGPFEATRFLDNSQRMICRWLLTAGFSVGISDLAIDRVTNDKLRETIRTMKAKAYTMIEQVRNDGLDNNSIFNNADFFEREIINILNETTKMVGSIGLDQIDEKTNRMINMVKSGSKGKETNVAQMIACVGQQNVDGKRVAYGFTDRTLPHFNKFDDGPEARGFVENSFISGLSPSEVFFHAMGGREGLIDTAVKSVTYDTKVLIMENSVPKVIKMGEWIDGHLAKHASDIVHHGPEDANMELVDLSKLGVETFIPSCDEKGKVQWCAVTNITRHDPSEFIYKIRTKWGREVAVVASKSLLVWNEETKVFEQKNTIDVKVGDKMPTTWLLPEAPMQDEQVACVEGKEFVFDGSIPTEAYVAAKESVKGIVRSFFANANIAKSIDTAAGIATLLARFGIVVKIDAGEGRVWIASKDVGEFRESFGMDVPEGCVWVGEENVDGELACEDTILDPIVSIEAVRADSDPLYNKVYDITVPATLNFQIFNGLNCADTSETGYLQRRLVKAMEDCKVYYDNTVRNATGSLIQFLYGEDGMDGTKMENQPLRYIDMPLMDMDAEFYLRKEDENKMRIAMTPAALKETLDADVFDRAREHYHALLEDRVFLIEKVFRGQKNDKITFPIPFTRIITNAVGRSRTAGLDSVPTDLSAKHVLDTLDALIERLRISEKNQGTRFLNILLRLHLSPKPVLLKWRLHRATFDWVVSEIERFYIQAIAPPGEMVGIVSAQTMGENSTQLVLDSFHSSGTVAAVKATSGVPRFKELLGSSKHIKTPILTIYLKPDIASVVNPSESSEDTGVQEAKARTMKVMRSFEITRLSDILESTDIYWDPPGESGLDTGLPQDIGLMDVYRVFNAVEKEKCRSTSPWVLRMKLNRENMHRLGLTMMDIYLRIHSTYSSAIDCVFSDDNADDLIFRVRLTKAALKETEAENEVSESDDAIAALKAIEHNIIHNVLLKGIKGIKKVSMHLKTKEKKRATTDVYNAQDLVFDRVAEWVLDTDGTNLQEILANVNVDETRTHSNDIWEIFHTFGIEAARRALHREIMEVVGEDALNYRHVSLLLDTMTNRGTLMSVDRHGINRGDVGPLAKCSFEETTDMLINASIFSEHDKINGVSANIMLGQLPPCGTGDCEVLLDEERYIQLLSENAGRVARHVRDVVEPIQPDEYQGLVDEADPCGYNAISFGYELPAKMTGVQFPEMKVAVV